MSQVGKGGDRATAAAHMWALQSGCCVSSDDDDDDYDSMTRATPIEIFGFLHGCCAICWPFSWPVAGRGRGLSETMTSPAR